MSDQTTDPPSTQQTLTLQEAVDLAGDVLGGLWLLEDDFQNIYAIEVSGTPQEGLLTVVMLPFVDHEVEVLEVPTGKCACRLAHIPLGVVADSYRK